MSKILAFGEIMLRLTANNNSLINETRQFDASYGGSEANVMIALSVLGNKTEYITALPDNELGTAVLKLFNTYKVGTENIKIQGDTLGMYFLEEGFAGRPNKVIYNRRNSEVTRLTKNDFNYDLLFKDCKIFHISGISFALSESVKELCFSLIKEAKKRNILVSFDFNYRAKLWSVDTAAAVYKEIIPFVDILFCSEKDINVFLGIDLKEFYNTYSSKYLMVREREILPDGKHSVFVRAFEKNNDEINAVNSENVTFSVLERIGGGDAFDAGVLHILSNCGKLTDAVNFGIACFVLKHTLRGDIFTLTEDAVKNYIINTSGDVSR